MNDRQRPHHRRSIRLPDYDYAQSGVYFVTICAEKRECLFGEILADAMLLSPFGQIVLGVWQALPRHFASVELDAFVVMPNHVHSIVKIVGEANGHPKEQPLPAIHDGTQPGSLAAIVQNFKSVTTRKINQLRGLSGKTIWQRNYHERVIRNQRELEAKRQYIANNPMQWALDAENPKAKPNR